MHIMICEFTMFIYAGATAASPCILCSPGSYSSIIGRCCVMSTRGEDISRRKGYSVPMLNVETPLQDLLLIKKLLRIGRARRRKGGAEKQK